MHKLLPFLFIITLTACIHIDPVTAFRLLKLDLLEIDPAETQLRAEYPNDWDVVPNSFIFTLTAKNETTNETINHELPLVKTNDTWGLDAPSQTLITQTQNTIKSWKSAGEKGRGTIGFSIKFCYHTDPTLQGTYSIFVKPSNDLGFLHLIQDRDIAALKSAEMPDFEKCDHPAPRSIP